MGDQTTPHRLPIQSVNFSKFIGMEASLYYNNKSQQFQLGDVLFEVNEDPDDGYRSHYESVTILDINAPRREGDFLGRVKIEDGDMNEFSGYRLRDVKDNHIWLSFGTDHTDSYYPFFCFDFYPRKP